MHWWSHSGLYLLWYLLLVSVLSWMSSSCLVFTTVSSQNNMHYISSMALRYLLSFVTLCKSVQLLCRHLVCFHEFLLAWERAGEGTQAVEVKTRSRGAAVHWFPMLESCRVDGNTPRRGNVWGEEIPDWPQPWRFCRASCSQINCCLG